MPDTMTGTLRILAVHRYYWPDTPPYASLLRAIATRWVERGHQVDVMSTQPSYKPEAQVARRPRTERVAGAMVRRVTVPSDRRGRHQQAANALLFPVAVFLRVLISRRHDVVMCSTFPPVLLGALVCLAARIKGARFIYHCMDLHPEIGRLSGEFNAPWLYRLLLHIDLWTCRRATAIVVLSDDMRDVLTTRDPGLAERIHVINNFDLPDYADDTTVPGPEAEADEAESDQAVSDQAESGRVTILFAGNIGRFQGLHEVVDAVTSDPHLADLELVLMGDGTAKRELHDLARREPWRNGRVRFLDHGNPTQARQMMRSVDLGLVSLTPGIIRYAFPSKTATYLAESLPIVAIVEEDTELARLVIDERIGFVAPPRDPHALRQTLRRVLDERTNVPDMRKRASQVAHDKFGRDVMLARWEALVEDVAGDRGVSQ